MQQMDFQGIKVEMHTLQNRLESDFFPPVATLGKAVLQLHDGPGLAAKSPKLGTEYLVRRRSSCEGRGCRWVM